MRFLLLFGLLFFPTVIYSAGIVIATSNVPVVWIQHSIAQIVTVDAGLTINDPQTNLPYTAQNFSAGYVLFIGYNANEDVITCLPSAATGFTLTQSANVNGSGYPGYTITAAAKPASSWATLFRSFRYSNSSQQPHSRLLQIRFSVGEDQLFYALDQPGGTGHFYKYVSLGGPIVKTWTTAKESASSSTYFGLTGYLATFTSQLENDFVVGQLDGNAWLGGSDDIFQTWTYLNSGFSKNQVFTTPTLTSNSAQTNAEGTWYWATGPEAGTQIWDSKGYTDANEGIHGTHNIRLSNDSLSERFTAWANYPEPNNAGGENFLHIYKDNATWNDFSNTNSSIAGYIVEYGGLPSDPTVTLRTNASIYIYGNNTSWYIGF